jgi:hypothetical protein
MRSSRLRSTTCVVSTAGRFAFPELPMASPQPEITIAPSVKPAAEIKLFKKGVVFIEKIMEI